MGADDPRTKKGNEPYPASEHPGVGDTKSHPTSTPGGPVSAPAPTGRPVAIPARGPVHPDTNRPGEEAPPGSSTTTVPQQVPKGTPPAPPTQPDKQ